MAEMLSASSTQPIGALPSTQLSDKDFFEIQEYEKIVRLHETLSKRDSEQALPITKTAVETTAQSTHSQSTKQPASHTRDEAIDRNTHALRVPLGQVALDPIFLEKSDQLVKAEVQLQRQRLEQALKDESEQRRSIKAIQSEPASVLDLSDVFAKAVSLAQAPEASAAAGEKALHADVDATDSLDESTFYSSRHDTPESHLTSRVRDLPADVQAANPNARQEEALLQVDKRAPSGGPVASAMAAGAHGPAASNQTKSHVADIPLMISQITTVPGLNNYVQGQSSASAGLSKNTSEVLRSQLVDSRAVPAQVPSIATRPPNPKHVNSRGHPASPLVRNHTLQPVAPQPTNPSSLSALANASPAMPHPPSASGSCRSSAMANPAQVAALRVTSGRATSPETSSQGGKKGKRRKKRKADRQAPDAEVVASVKAEPRSSSPLHAPAHIRPSKRQRHAQDPTAVHEYESRYDPANVHGVGVQYVSRLGPENGVAVGYTSAPRPRPRGYSSTAAGYVRYNDGQYYEESWLPVEEPELRGGRDRHSEMTATPRQARPLPIPRATSQVFVPESRPPGSRQYRDDDQGNRMTSHPDEGAFVAPPRPAPARILIGSYGPEYIEPFHHHPPPSHLSVASPSGQGEHEVVYERLRPRAMSRHPAPAVYEDGSFVYAGAPSQAYPVPRRVLTQPEYATHEYRDAGDREFPVRPPSTTAGDFVRVYAPPPPPPPPPPERRYGEDGYFVRPTSVRPAQPVTYQVSPDYGRVHSVRPELHGPVSYRASVHRESGPEDFQPYMREYRPARTQELSQQRRMSLRPADGPPSRQSRGAEDVAFIERQSDGTQEVVYADDARREVYRAR